MMTSANTDSIASSPLPAAHVADLARALADPLRAQIVVMLADEELCTCHLVDGTGARQTNVSNHLRVLREAGLVTSEQVGRYTWHRLRPEGLAALVEHLTSVSVRAAGAAGVRRAPC
ncbi:MAG: metalloregulator ArsR/SmtB family transcription factor [Nocardioides sp.]|nr:metalloregulator ArsR/SmtB family transcription factor [Nocardioides sp.]